MVATSGDFKLATDMASGLLPEVLPPQCRCPSNRGMLNTNQQALFG